MFLSEFLNFLPIFDQSYMGGLPGDLPVGEFSCRGLCLFRAGDSATFQKQNAEKNPIPLRPENLLWDEVIKQ